MCDRNITAVVALQQLHSSGTQREYVQQDSTHQSPLKHNARSLLLLLFSH